MNAELEKMIRFATEDGSITDKEREIIIRKALEMGADIDEVEIILESELAKNNKAVEAPAMKKPKEKVRKCPRCGAVIDDGALSCPDCGFVFTEQSSLNEEVEKRINDLKRQLLLASKSKQITLIQGFTIPATKEGLIQFLNYSFSNYIGQGDDGELKEAWKGKYLQAANNLKRFSQDDPELYSLLQSYENQLSKEKNERIKNSFIGSKGCVQKGCLGVVLCCVLFGVSMVIMMSQMGNLQESSISLLENSQKQQNQDNETLSQIEQCISERDFDGAKRKANMLNNKKNSVYDDICVEEIDYLITEEMFDKAKVVMSSIHSLETKKAMKELIDNAQNN